MTDSHQAPETIWTITHKSPHSQVMNFDGITRVLVNSSYNEEVARALLNKLKRCAMAMGALMGKALDVSHYKYAVYPDDPRRRQLHMWCSDFDEGEHCPTCSIRLHLSATGQIESNDDLVIIMSSTFKARHQRP